MDFDDISHKLSHHCGVHSNDKSSDIPRQRMLYKDPKLILSAILGRRTPEIMEYKGKRIYLYENDTRPEILALVDSESGLSESELYDAVFRKRSAVVGVYVREVIGLDEIIPSLSYLLKDNKNRLNA